VIADIPGLIEGAHHGAGLGHRFLRHVERTRLLVHLIGPPDSGENLGDPSHYLYAYDLVNAELRAYTQRLAAKPQIVCLTKLDLLTEAIVADIKQAFETRGIQILPISAHDQLGLQTLITRIQEELGNLHNAEAVALQPDEEPFF
jgi:GTPase